MISYVSSNMMLQHDISHIASKFPIKNDTRTECDAAQEVQSKSGEEHFRDGGYSGKSLILLVFICIMSNQLKQFQ
jgi:hypothetical protein